MDNIRNAVGFLGSTILAYFNPVQNIFMGVAWVFLVNFFFGFMNGVLVRGESFEFKKAFRCFTEAAVIFFLMATIFFAGERIGNKAGAIQCITAIVYASFYFYGLNVLRNLKGIFPNNKLILFLYTFLSIEFVKDIPLVGSYLQKFNRRAEDEDDKHNTQA